MSPPLMRSLTFAGGLSLLAAAPPAVAQQGRLRAEWTDYALQYRDQIDRRLTFVCPPGGTPGKVFGTDDYTADSSVCSAAAHAGVIDPEKGGTVTIVVGKGLSSYEGSTRNNVTSEKYGAFTASFRFERENLPGQVDWATTAVGLDLAGGPVTLVCPPEGDERRVWGTDIYTEDSSICVAAVHAGRISFRSGGTVTIEPTGAQESYSPSERNGVTSIEWRSWPKSFSVSGGPPETETTKPAPPPPGVAPVAASYSISVPTFGITGSFEALVTARDLSTSQLSVTGIFIPLVTARSITTPTLVIQGQ